ncbi:hypothetical protein ACFSKL_11610 [Belliella marina]|uniref:Lipocalin-like domain-containing protein n=1 Tax=Belliella marina TaxID=1644146 RepID=A0ABW4VQ82_9BACT
METNRTNNHTKRIRIKHQMCYDSRFLSTAMEYLLHLKIDAKFGKTICRNLTLFLSIIFYSCHDYESEATHNLLGDWQVNEVIITFGSVPLSQDSVWYFEGDIGDFLFEREILKYNYLSNELNQQGESEYVLTSSKEKAGFNSVRKWLLKMSDREYEIEFDDGTKRSYENANKITMINYQIQIASDIHSTIVLELTKK